MHIERRNNDNATLHLDEGARRSLQMLELVRELYDLPPPFQKSFYFREHIFPTLEDLKLRVLNVKEKLEPYQATSRVTSISLAKKQFEILDETARLLGMNWTELMRFVYTLHYLYPEIRKKD